MDASAERVANSPQGWQPIAPDSLTGRVLAVAKYIADSICDSYEPPENTARRLSLGGGIGGPALYLANAYRTFGDGMYASCAKRLIDQLMEEAAEHKDLSLFGGVAGIAMLVDLALQLLGELKEAESVGDSDLDEAIEICLTERPWLERYDLISGLAGLAMYGLHRRLSVRGQQIYREAIDQLERVSTRRAPGLTWRTPMPDLPETADGAQYSERIDLGIAHGVPGVIAVLAEGKRCGLLQSSKQHLLTDAVSWLLDQMNPPHDISMFGTYTRQPYARLTWCYGDPGILMALIRAELAGGMPQGQEVIRQLVQSVVRRPCNESMLDKDPGICHGSGGLLHILNAAYQSLGVPELKAHALSALEQTVRIYETASGSLRPAWNDLNGAGIAYGFGYLLGSSGTALSLLATVSPHWPKWDTPMLISVHPSVAAGTPIPSL